MATLTELQKQGISDLLQDWSIGDAIDYDRIQPISTYEPPPGASESYRQGLTNENLRGFVESVGPSNYPPPGNPSGIGKEYGANPGIYVRNIDQFQPEWTPGATAEGRVNRDLADVVGHEGRHAYFEKHPELYKDIEVTALGNNRNVAGEELNLWLDMVAGGKGLSESDIYQNRRIKTLYKYEASGRRNIGYSWSCRYI